MKKREMKDSGIPWIGMIPKEWEIENIGSCLKEVNEPNINCAEDNALQFKMGHIISKKNGDSKYNPESLAAYNQVDVNDIIINGLNLSFDFVSLRIGQVREKGVITSAYLSVRPLPHLYSDYITYLLKGYDGCKALHGMGKGLRQTLSYREFKKYKIFYPDYQEQKAIAEFLDRKCGEIDELVALQNRMIQELKAYKQSVITEAVTKGLNPNAPLKDSGIEWIGQIPQHWDSCRIKDIVNLQSGKNLTTEDISEEGDYPVYGGNGLRGYYTKYSDEGEFILIGRQGALCGNINYAYGKFWPTEHAVVCYPKISFSLIWLGELLRSMNLRQYSLSSAQPGLAVERIKNLHIPIPPLSEQQEIADFLDEKCSEIDSLIALKQTKIEELKDYKKSIIYEYVTGKKEVEINAI